MKTRLIKRNSDQQDILDKTAKFYKFHANGCGLHGYTTIDILESIIGTYNLVDACKRALDSHMDNFSRKFRCGLRIDFYGF